MNSLRLTLAVFSLSLAALNGAWGCATARPYVAPADAPPAAWASRTGDTAAAPDMVVLADWWTTFNDATLTSLIQRAVAGNTDVKTAVSRLREARASLASTRGTRKPTADGSGSARVSNGEPAVQSYGLQLDASWEPDLFGGIGSRIASAEATAHARYFDAQDVLVSLTAEVALGYIGVRTAQERIELTRTNLSLQEQTLELTRFRARAGLATEIDVQQALANVESTRAQVEQLLGEVVRGRHALAVLLGRPPATLDAELAVNAPIPSAPISIAVGVPAETLRRRPDVRSAERQVAAQFAQVNAARADLYPSFRLSGSIGLQALSIAKLFVPAAGFWNAGASSSARIFNRTQLRQNLVIQTERQEQAVQTYESRVLSALKDVEDALTSLTQEQARREHLIAAEAATRQVVELSLQLYSSGLRDFQTVLDGQRSLLSLQDSMASSTATVSENLVRLYKAVGGGWPEQDAKPRG